MRVGGNDYTADVLVGTMNDGSLMLYDVADLTPTTIKGRAERGTVSSENRENRSLALGSTNSITDNAEESNAKTTNLQSRFPDLTEADRQAAAQAGRTGNAHINFVDCTRKSVEFCRGSLLRNNYQCGIIQTRIREQKKQTAGDQTGKV